MEQCSVYTKRCAVSVGVEHCEGYSVSFCPVVLLCWGHLLMVYCRPSADNETSILTNLMVFLEHVISVFQSRSSYSDRFITLYITVKQKLQNWVSFWRQAFIHNAKVHTLQHWNRQLHYMLRYVRSQPRAAVCAHCLADSRLGVLGGLAGHRVLQPLLLVEGQGAAPAVEAAVLQKRRAVTHTWRQWVRAHLPAQLPVWGEAPAAHTDQSDLVQILDRTGGG